MYPGWSPAQQFQAWYATELGKLTFNSRPIIDKLSMAALERKREGDWEGMGVVGEVLRRGIEVVSRRLRQRIAGRDEKSVGRECFRGKREYNTRVKRTSRRGRKGRPIHSSEATKRYTRKAREQWSREVY